MITLGKGMLGLHPLSIFQTFEINVFLFHPNLWGKTQHDKLKMQWVLNHIIVCEDVT